VQVANPDISNPDISNSDISNPDISNPDISNPDISNPDINNATPGDDSLTDTTWTLTNNGNTTTSYSINLLLNGLSPDPNLIALQLILHKTYKTPVAVNCTLVTHTHNVLLANITNPVFTNASEAGQTDIADPAASNATLWLAPGESAKVTLRVRDLNVNDQTVFVAEDLVTPVVVPQALDVSLVDGVLVIGEDVDVAVPLNALFLNVPANGVAGTPLGPISVQVLDASEAAIPGVNVSLSVRTVGTNAQIGTTLTALTEPDGTATYTVGALPAGTYRFLAQVAPVGSPPAAAWSDAFVIGPAPVQWAVASGGNGHYYEYVRIGGLSWSAARDAAAARSYLGITGRLVTITSAGENTFVTSLRNGDDLRAWIGLLDPDGPDDVRSFSWITGEPVTFTNWSVGEPNNLQAEFFVELFADGTWNNNREVDGVSPTFGYIVEYAPEVIFMVTNTEDGGAGSLRQAMLSANDNGASADRIAFNIPGDVPHMISLASPLPAITQPVSIDGTTQPTYSGSPVVFIDGADVGENPGLRVEAPNAEIRGLGIVGFGGGAAIQLWSGGNALVRGNLIGFTGVGEAAGNQVGIDVHGLGNRIGGTAAGDRNVISNNNLGIFLQSDSSATIIQGNHIGTNAAGTAAVPNVTGILADDTSGATIGGTGAGARNVISGNTGNGILFSNGSGFQILGNYIGTNAAGAADLGNGSAGIRLNGNSRSNVIGLPGAGNVISGNTAGGIVISDSSSENIVRSNLIGLDATGTLAVGNGTRNEFFDLVGAGIQVDGFENEIGRDGAGNVISGNGTGVSLSGLASTNTIRGNLIGTNASGTAAVGNRFGIFNAGADTTQIGGIPAGEGNVVSGNTVEGIAVTLKGSTGVIIEGNRIGTNNDGTSAIGNTFDGIRVGFAGQATIGGGPAGGANIIAFNGSSGINATGNGNAILHNSIFSNGGLGINQNGGGVQDNDPGDVDGVQNFPVLTSARNGSASVRIQGELTSTANTAFQIRFFVSPTCDASGHGEGQVQIASLDGVSTNSDGQLTIDLTVGPALPPGTR
jgi:hypothetical protein